MKPGEKIEVQLRCGWRAVVVLVDVDDQPLCIREWIYRGTIYSPYGPIGSTDFWTEQGAYDPEGENHAFDIVAGLPAPAANSTPALAPQLYAHVS